MKLFRNLLIALLPVLFLFLTVPTAHASTVLGGMDLNGWCASQNQGTAVLNSSNQWACSGNNQVIDFTANPTPNCVWQYKVTDAFATNGLTPTDPNYKYAWQCSTNTTGTTPTPTPTIATGTPTPTPTGQFISDVKLINTDTQNAILDPFTFGSTVSIVATPHLNINAITSPAKVGSVTFKLDTKTHIENGAPYDDPSDSNNGHIFNPFNPTLTVGKHTIVITPWSAANGTGTKGTATTITFTVTNTVPTPTPTVAPTTDDWFMNKYDPARSGYNANETTLNATSMVNLTQKLDIPPATPSAMISTSPAVVNNVMYYGDWTGSFYARNVKDGSIVWTTNIGVDTPPAKNHCNPPSIGVASAPAYKEIIVNGTSTPALIVAGGDGNLYALKASDGSVIWKTPLTDITTGGFLWDSPVVSGGSVYEGLASFGDCPLVQGKMFKLDMNTGTVQATTSLVPDGCIGAGEWASPTVDEPNGKIYITTGTNNDNCKVNGVTTREPNALGVMEFDMNLNILGAWRLPLSEQIGDADFGVSPALATATINGVQTQIVEAANKNGHMYLFKRDHISDGPYADVNLGIHGGGNCPDCSDGTIATAVTDGITLYQPMGMCSSLAGGPTSNCATQGFNSYLFAINPADGSTIWKTPIAKQIVSTPILLKDSIIIMTGNSIEVLRKSDGAVIKTVTPPGGFSIFDGTGAVARGMLFVGNLNGNFYELGL